MKYPKVQHSHIVPRAYLRGFAVNGLLDMRLAGSGEPKRVSVRDAAVRRDAYKRTRPSGEVIYDVEWSIGQAENKALPLVRNLATQWPLDVADKGAVGTIFALQLLRGPRWMNWYAEKIANTHEALQGKDISSPGGVVLPPALVEVASHRLRQQLQTDSARLLRMLHMINKVAAIFASMHWTLIEFNDHLIATSDHPVVPWERDTLLTPPQPSQPQGLIDTIEVRIPVSSSSALLLTWIDDVDHRRVGTVDQAERFNSFTVASAEHQWFHRPGCPPPMGPRSHQAPISMIGGWHGYDAHGAARSARRAQLNPWLQAQIGAPEMSQEMRVVSATRAA